MPEVILPCPACGCARVDTHTPEGDTRLIYIIPNAYVSCDDCDCRGPLCSSDHAAIAAWNAMPRALTWTHEPPKVAGWYWCRVSKLYQPRLVEVYDSEDGLRFGSGDSWQEPSMSVESCGFEWAGPIVPPIEA